MILVNEYKNIGSLDEIVRLIVDNPKIALLSQDICIITVLKNNSFNNLTISQIKQGLKILLEYFIIADDKASTNLVKVTLNDFENLIYVEKDEFIIADRKYLFFVEYSTIKSLLDKIKNRKISNGNINNDNIKIIDEYKGFECLFISCSQVIVSQSGELLIWLNASASDIDLLDNFIQKMRSLDINEIKIPVILKKNGDCHGLL